MFDDEDNDQEGLFTRLLATLFMVLAVVVFGTLSLPRVKSRPASSAASGGAPPARSQASPVKPVATEHGLMIGSLTRPFPALRADVEPTRPGVRVADRSVQVTLTIAPGRLRFAGAMLEDRPLRHVFEAAHRFRARLVDGAGRALYERSFEVARLCVEQGAGHSGPHSGTRASGRDERVHAATVRLRLPELRRATALELTRLDTGDAETRLGRLPWPLPLSRS